MPTLDRGGCCSKVEAGRCLVAAGLPLPLHQLQETQRQYPQASAAVQCWLMWSADINAAFLLHADSARGLLRAACMSTRSWLRDMKLVLPISTIRQWLSRVRTPAARPVPASKPRAACQAPECFLIHARCTHSHSSSLPACDSSYHKGPDGACLCPDALQAALQGQARLLQGWRRMGWLESCSSLQGCLQGIIHQGTGRPPWAIRTASH